MYVHLLDKVSYHTVLKIASPACTDLEVVMMDWLGQLLGLPSHFLACSGGTGGGVIQVITMSRINNHLYLFVSVEIRERPVRQRWWLC